MKRYLENLLPGGDAVVHILFFTLLNDIPLPWSPECFTKPLCIEVMPTVGK